MINDMPLVLDSLEVTKGRRYGKVAPTIQVKMFPEVMKPFSWFVKAGFGCFVPGMELEEFSPEFFIGGGGRHTPEPHDGFPACYSFRLS